jgi:hypothetical protein
MNNQGQVRAGLAIIGPAACALALTLSIRPYPPPPTLLPCVQLTSQIMRMCRRRSCIMSASCPDYDVARRKDMHSLPESRRALIDALAGHTRRTPTNY